MAKITAAMVKELRETTGAGMMDCKKALTATDGDAAAAVDWLREKGIAKAAKKSGRVAAEGAVGAYVTPDGKTGAVVEINCETDFAAGNEQFKSLLAKVAQHIAETKPADLDALNNSELDGQKVSDITFTLNDESAKADNPATTNVTEANFYQVDGDAKTEGIQGVVDPDQGVLPTTGEAGTFAVTAAGVVLVAGGITLVMGARKRSQE